MPLREIRTISPGSTSRTYSASIKSNAQVSDAATQAPSRRPKNQRTEAARVANRIHFVARKKQQRIRAFHLTERVGERAGKIARSAARDQMHDHLGVAGGLENRAAMFEPAAHFQRVRQVAVVAERDLALVAIDHDRLRVDQGVVARRGIARVADGGPRRAGAPSRPA